MRTRNENNTQIKLTSPANKLSGKDCVLCRESKLKVGQKTGYGAVVIYSIGDSDKDGWFATLSPRTGGDPQEDFSIQLSPFAHLTNFSNIHPYPKLAKNYGIAFSALTAAIGKILSSQYKLAYSTKNIIPIGTYGKCKHLDEHIHIKLFPWRGNVGQPYTVDSSFQRKEVYTDPETGKEFVKMIPVVKSDLSEKRFNELSKKLIELLK